MTLAKNMPGLSVVIPLFNEEEVLPVLLKELTAVCESIKTGDGRRQRKPKPINYEVILVDDGSTDKTFELIERAAKENPNIKAIRFSRNFGHQAAFNAGIDFASGEAVLTMDGDLQHPPRLIPEFIKRATEGYDIVVGERLMNKQNSRAREFLGNRFYKVLTAISGLEFRNASDFALYNRSVISTIKRLPEKERFLRGIVQWVGFKKKYVPYVVEERKAGKPKYNIKKLFTLVMSGITSFSAFPLRLAFWAGLFVFIGSILFGGYVVWDHYANPNPLIAGWATVVILILFLGSIQLMVLGVVGEYLYKMFNEVKGRPLYIVHKTLNVDHKNVEQTPYGIHNL